MTRSTWRAVIIGVLLGISASALAALVGATAFGHRVENGSYDLRVRATASPVSSSSPIVIVEINESSIRGLEPVVGRWPWPRLVHGSAIDYLKRSGARVIAYDVLFGEREGARESIVNGQPISGDDSDRLLVESVRRAGNVVLLGDATFEGLASGKLDRNGQQPTRAAGSGLPAGRRVPVETRLGPAVRCACRPRPPASGTTISRAIRARTRLVARCHSSSTRGAFVPSLGVAAALMFAGVTSD